METKSFPFLVAGLGNVGKTYDGTRHNIGFAITNALAAKYGALWKSQDKVKGEIASCKTGEKTLYLLKPTTFMNASGQSLRLCTNYYKIPLENILVVVDDVDIPFGEFRIRKEGSAGTHNGLKSIENELATTNYPRFRVGIGTFFKEELADFVLSKFSLKESEELPLVIEKAISYIELWLNQGIEAAMNQANVKLKKESC